MNAPAPVLLPCGDRAVLVEFTDPAAVLPATAALRAQPPAGLIDLVPAERTVLVILDRPPELDAIAGALAAVPLQSAGAAGAAAEPVVRIEVSYDGPDLDEVAAATGLPRAEVIRRHTAAEFVASFCGFAPGFAYLTGIPAGLQVPRRSTPRVAVPAGSVAIAERYSAVYPRRSPGGWQLIGTTSVQLWDADRDPPALLVPGTRVQFVDIAGPDAHHH